MNKTEIAFKNYRMQDIHGCIQYPARMIAPMQEAILGAYASRGIKTIIDPFCGSGTSLLAVHNVIPSIFVMGNDINPFAVLITKVKLAGVNTSVRRDIEYLRKKLNNPSPEIKSFHFEGIEKWFRPDIIASLSRVRELIIRVKNKRNRLFFWCIFADIVRKYSNSRSSTFKLHIKEKTSVDLLVNNVIEDFVNKIMNDSMYFLHRPYKYQVHREDTLELLPFFRDKEFDMMVTSPPYGDNATTVTYGQFSWFALNWIDACDLEMDGWEKENSSIIDSRSMGGVQRVRAVDLDKTQHDLIEPYIYAICAKKTKKVLNFFFDYFCFLDEATRITKRYIIMTLGNRTVDRVKIPLSDITAKYLETKGYVIRERLSRDIPHKRIPRVVSRVRGQAVDSMNKEYVVVAERRA